MKFIANSRHFKIFFGIFFLLLGLIMICNIGPLAKLLTIGPTWLLGITSYFIYIFFYVIAFFLLFKSRLPKIKVNNNFFASILVFVAFEMIFAHIMARINVTEGYLGFYNANDGSVVNFTDSYASLFTSLTSEGYFEIGFINILPLGSGFLGYALISCFNDLFSFRAGGAIVGIIILLIGIFLYTAPYILSSISNTPKHEVKENKSKKESNQFKEMSSNQTAHIHVNNYDVISNASKIDPDQYESEVTGAPSSTKAPSTPYINQNQSFYLGMSVSENGVMIPAHFVREGDQSVNNQPQTKPEEMAPINQTPIQTQNIIINNQPEKIEQMQLNFDEVQEDIVPAAKPIAQPQVAPQPVVNNQIYQQKPIEKPKEDVRPKVKWVAPSSELLADREVGEALEKNKAAAIERQELINSIFQDFGIGAHVEDFTIGSSVTRFNVKYDSNVSSRSVNNIKQDISIRLGGISTRFETVIEGQSSSGLEIPNEVTTTVSFKEVYNALPDVKKHPLSVAFGKNIKGEVVYADFDEFPHILIAGTTGSGKSIYVNSIIATLIMRNSPDDLKLVLVDPKRVEMSRYKDMPHLLCPIINDPVEAKNLINKLCDEMQDRYSLFENSNGATNIKEYNSDCEANGNQKLPYIIVVLDEYADIVDQCKEISLPVVSLAQKARACGIHLLISTQRPSTNVVTGVIKANLPTHVALMTASAVDSVTIIGEGGAEKLLGKGDMLVQSPLVSRVGVTRLQGCYIDRYEIMHVVNYLTQHYETHYDEKFLNLTEKAEASANEFMQTPEFKDSADSGEENKYQAIKEWVLSQEFMSISRIQRECAVGFNRAGRFFLRLQSEGVIGTDVEGNKGCKVNNNKFDNDTVVTSDEQTSFRSDD